jgi:hypothetical protein
MGNVVWPGVGGRPAKEPTDRQCDHRWRQGQGLTRPKAFDAGTAHKRSWMGCCVALPLVSRGDQGRGRDLDSTTHDIFLIYHVKTDIEAVVSTPYPFPCVEVGNRGLAQTCARKQTSTPCDNSYEVIPRTFISRVEIPRDAPQPSYSGEPIRVVVRVVVRLAAQGFAARGLLALVCGSTDRRLGAAVRH